MARFRATLQGARGEASRLGSPTSGMVTNLNGWHAGVKVTAEVDENGDDIFNVYMTHGSNGGGARTYLGTVGRGLETGDLMFVAPNVDHVLG